jgi:uncharacterized protein (TIGR00369 family)
MAPENDMRTRSVGHETSKTPKVRNHCFGCGEANDRGLQLKFSHDDDGEAMVCRFKLASHYVGPPGHAHGGVIATILDEAMGKANKLKQILALTREMTVEYLRPVPLGEWLIVEGRNQAIHGRVCTNIAEIRRIDGEVLARSKGKFIAIDAEKMFAKYLQGKQADEAMNNDDSPEGALPED